MHRWHAHCVRACVRGMSCVVGACRVHAQVSCAPCVLCVRGLCACMFCVVVVHASCVHARVCLRTCVCLCVSWVRLPPGSCLQTLMALGRGSRSW